MSATTAGRERLLHYSSKPVESVYSTHYPSVQATGAYRRDKPTGLWVSVEGEDDWRSWCESESFGDPASQLCYEVEVAPSANILRIETVAQLRHFSRENRIPDETGRPYVYGIKWLSLSTRYDGIIIAPYQWECRLGDDTHWYYGWDCASGCIWNAEAIASLTLVCAPQARERVA